MVGSDTSKIIRTLLLIVNISCFSKLKYEIPVGRITTQVRSPPIPTVETWIGKGITELLM
jgi:hypothetical protein